ncbi:hypothetical protein LUZ60_004034 [Juncus effusus]|nr:hypothetical protein LUZ60_004034 [Juncus effusus]
MAEIVVSSLLNKISGMLLNETLKLCKGSKESISKLELELTQLNAFVKDADSKVWVDEKVKSWVRDLREIGYEIEDVLEKYSLSLAKTKIESKNFVSWGFRKSALLLAERELGESTKRIEEKIRIIGERRIMYGIRCVNELEVEKIEFKSVRSVTDIEVKNLREKEGKEITQTLVENPNKVRSLVIVGQAGLGKSTFAKELFNNTEIIKHFPYRMWLDFSQVKGKSDIFEQMFKQVVKGDISQNMRDQPENNVKLFQKLLSLKRFLIVLDNVSCKDGIEYINEKLPETKNGSWVLITTRYHNLINKKTNYSVKYELPLLTEEDSHKLLIGNAFRYNPVFNCPEELADLAKLFVKRCDGLPSALLMLGRILSERNSTYNSWIELLENHEWFGKGKDGLNPIVSMYYELTFDLKLCFLYLATVVEGGEINSKELLRMWVAEGFVHKGKDETESVEFVAKNMLEELGDRSVISVTERSSSGAIKTFRLHRLFRELAIRLGKETNFMHVYSSDRRSSFSREARRQTLLSENPHPIQEISINPNILRSFITRKVTVPSTIMNFKLLRVLALYGIDGVTLLTKIGSMKNIRLITIDKCGTVHVPKSISKLHQLEVFTVRRTIINELPESIWKIKSLIHFHVPRSAKVKGPPSWSENVNLQGLEMVELRGDWSVRLPGIAAVRKLGVCNPGVVSWDVLVNVVNKLEKLDSLKIASNGSIYDMLNCANDAIRRRIKSLCLCGKWEVSKQFLDFKYPPNITKIELKSLELVGDPMGVLGKLETLKVLVLSDAYVGRDMTCLENAFPKLQRLTLDSLKNLHKWNIQKDAMQCLESLSLRDCGSLDSLPDLHKIKTLRCLKVERMAQGFYDIIEKDKGPDWEKIKRIPVKKILQ